MLSAPPRRALQPPLCRTFGILPYFWDSAVLLERDSQKYGKNPDFGEAGGRRGENENFFDLFGIEGGHNGSPIGTSYCT